MNNIPSNDEVRIWYNETLKLPSFLDTLNNYQKGKLFEYCKNKISETIEFASDVLNAKPENEYPEEIPIDKRFEYILNTTFKHSNSEPIYILNLLGYTWTPEESYKQIESKKPNNKKFKQKEVALILYYSNRKVVNPKNDKSNRLKKEVSNFGIDNSDTSLEQLYWTYKKIELAKEEQKEDIKFLESLYLKFKMSKPETLKKYISNILDILEEDAKKKANQHIKKLDDLINLKY